MKSPEPWLITPQALNGRQSQLRSVAHSGLGGFSLPDRGFHPRLMSVAPPAQIKTALLNPEMTPTTNRKSSATTPADGRGLSSGRPQSPRMPTRRTPPPARHCGTDSIGKSEYAIEVVVPAAVLIYSSQSPIVSFSVERLTNHSVRPQLDCAANRRSIININLKLIGR